MDFVQEFYQGASTKLNNNQILEYMKSGKDEKLSNFYTNASTKLDDDQILEYMGYKAPVVNIDLGEPAEVLVGQDDFVTPADTRTTMTPEEVKTQEDIALSQSTLPTGAAATVAGAYQTGLDIAGGLGFDVKELDAVNQETIRLLNKEIEEVEQKLGTSEDWFTPSNVGRFIPALVTLPISYQSKLAAFLIEGSIGYAEARGEALDIPDSTWRGLFAGGLTAGTMGILDKLTGKGASNAALQYLQKEHGLSDEVVEEITNSYMKYMDADMTPETKVKAIIESLGERGAEYKAAAEILNPETSKAINQSTISRNKELQNIVSNGDISGAIKAVEDQKDFASFNFNQFREIIEKNFNQPIPLKLGQLDDLADELKREIDLPGVSQHTLNVNNAIIKAQEEGGYTLSGLLDLRQDLGALGRSGTSRKRTSELNKIQDIVDTVINDTMPNEGKQLWGMVKDEYKLMSAVQGMNKGDLNNAMGKVLAKAGTGKYSYAKVLDLVTKTPMSDDSMRQLMTAIGPKHQAMLERGLAKEVMTSNKEAIVYSDIFDKLKKIEMVTPEGQEVLKTVNELSKVFKSEDFINKVNNLVAPKPGQGGAAFTLDLVEKTKYLAMGKFFRHLTDMLDFSAAGRQASRLEDITTVLKTPSKAKERFGLSVEESTNLVRQAREQTIRDTAEELRSIHPELTKQLPPPKPGDKPLYATEKGTVAKTPTEAVMFERETELLQEYLSKPQFNRVTDTLGKVLSNSKRMDDLVKQIRQQTIKDDAKANEAMLNKIVVGEAKALIDIIERVEGVKLPTSEAEKIIKLKLNDLSKKTK